MNIGKNIKSGANELEKTRGNVRRERIGIGEKEEGKFKRGTQ